MFWVCDRSRAASTSSRMYIGAGEYCSRDKMSERAIRDLSKVLVVRRHLSKVSQQHTFDHQTAP